LSEIKLQNNLNAAKVSVIVTVQGQKEELATIHSQLVMGVNDYTSNYEIIYVDDGSSDGSWDQLEQIAHENDRVRLVKLRTTFGESSALDAGLSLAQGEILVYFTCRVRINPQFITKFLKKIDEGFDVVVGERYPRRDSGLNRIVSKIFNGLTNRFSKLELHDINSGVFVTRKEIIDQLPIYGAFNAFLPVLAFRQGYKVAEEKIEQLPGKFDQSMYPKNYIRRLLDLISVLFLSNYSKKPLHFLGFFGAIFFLSGAVIDLYLFIYRIFGFGGIAGRPMLLLGTVLLVIGVQMISIGLLGEMIIFTHAKNIREYNIEETIN
jgi:glycosyltransferase involved in cell wall biosynthesis